MISEVWNVLFLATNQDQKVICSLWSSFKIYFCFMKCCFLWDCFSLFFCHLILLFLMMILILIFIFFYFLPLLVSIVMILDDDTSSDLTILLLTWFFLGIKLGLDTWINTIVVFASIAHFSTPYPMHLFPSYDDCFTDHIIYCLNIFAQAIIL